MKRFGRASLVLALALTLSALASAADVDPKNVDQVFARWNRSDAPGASVLVLRDGKVAYRRGWGMANIEAGVQNTPATLFDAGSVSKQFTAFAIYLLAQDGKLSLGDEVRKYIPELRFAEPVTIEQLVHHTSGIRDYYSLFTLAGLREDDRISQEEIQRLIWRQRTLNFPPGTEQIYSNSGYFLLGLIVQRVSGQSLPDFARQRIFAPLKMEHTQFVDHYGTLLQGRALGYVPWKEGYRNYASSTAVPGPSGVYTTVDDLALWDANFHDARVGGAALLEAMQTPGVLKTGKVTHYAGGLMLKTYRQHPVVEHDGAETAYRAEALRFPGERLSIFILSNASNMNAPAMARRIADLYLADRPGSAEPAAPSPEIKLEVPADAAYLGRFQMRPNLVLDFSAENGKLMVQGTRQPKYEMFASAPDSFFTKAFDAQVSFDLSSRPVVSGTWRQNGQEFALQRIAAQPPSEAAMQTRSGDFYSDDLQTLYRVAVQGGRLAVGYWRGDVPLTPVREDLYVMPMAGLWIQFHRGADGRCDRAEVRTGRSRGMQFVRIQLPS